MHGPKHQVKPIINSQIPRKTNATLYAIPHKEEGTPATKKNTKEYCTNGKYITGEFKGSWQIYICMYI